MEVNLDIKDMPYGFKPDVVSPSNEILEILGEAGIRNLISDHYNLLVESSIKHLFPPKGLGLELAKKHSADFFIQRFGGPEYFNKTRGKPMLATRHSHFKITPSGRKEWLRCYQVLFENLELRPDLKQQYWDYLHDFSNWMVNTPEE
jgi:hemoglobin